MAHITVELHENYLHEKIADYEYGIVREEMAKIGCFNTANETNVEHHLPRACYFTDVLSRYQVKQAWQAIESRLGRKASVEASEGASFGFGLRPVVKQVPSYSLLGSLGSTVPAPSLAFANLLSGPAPKVNGSNLLGSIPTSLKDSYYGSLLGLLDSKSKF